MILYKKTFPLGNGISFFEYITALRKAYFPNYVITIDKIQSTENYRVQIFFTAPLWKWGWANAFPNGVLLKESTIYYSKDEGYFTLQASVTGWTLLIASFYVISSILVFIFVLFTMIAKNTISFNNIFILVISVIVLSAPSIWIYLRDKKLLDKVGSIGTDLEKN